MFFWCNSKFVVESVMPDLQEGKRRDELQKFREARHENSFNEVIEKLQECMFGQVLTFSISSQLVTIPCSMGYFRVRIPLLL